MMTTLTSEDKTVIVRIGNERKLSRKEQNEQKVLYRLIETIFFSMAKGQKRNANSRGTFSSRHLYYYPLKTGSRLALKT